MLSLSEKGYRRQPAPVPANAAKILTQPAFGAYQGLLKSTEQRLVAHLGDYYPLYAQLRDELSRRAVIAISAPMQISDLELSALPLRLRNLLYPRIVIPLPKVREFLAAGSLQEDYAFYVLHFGPGGPSLPKENYRRMVRTEGYEFGQQVGPFGGGH